MKAHVERDWIRQSVNVWLFEAWPASSGRGKVVRLGDGARDVTLEDVPDGALPAPTFSLSDDAFEALIAAGVDYAPPSSAQAAHLQDALTVRDRLLTLVENEMDVKR